MKTKRFLITFFSICILLVSLAGCGKNDADAGGIYGSWAYVHDKGTEIAVFHTDKTAKYEKKKYTFEYDDQFITLKDSKGDTIQLRYELNGTGMYLYKNTTYVYQGEGEPDGLVGEWVSKQESGDWTFTFTDQGTFYEDGVFPGYYSVGDDNVTFKLVYNDQFEDTVCYYQIEGNTLHIQYPWQMVHTGTK